MHLRTLDNGHVHLDATQGHQWRIVGATPGVITFYPIEEGNDQPRCLHIHIDNPNFCSSLIEKLAVEKQRCSAKHEADKQAQRDRIEKMARDLADARAAFDRRFGKPDQPEQVD